MAAVSTSLLLGTAGATVIALAGCASKVPAGGLPSATTDPVHPTLQVPSQPSVLTPTPIPTATPTATPTAAPAAKAPPITLAPTSVAYYPPTVTISVSPAQIYETYDAASNADCHSSSFDTTYADVTATITTSVGVASATVHWSFGGNSSPYGNSGSGALSQGSGNSWSTEVGGYVSTRFTISGDETVSYYAVVVDNHGTSVTSTTVTNLLQECDPTDPSGVNIQ
jgi:hypothetical protein